jgi:crossover junction endodeoxyribonuclease RuvC
MTIFIGIDLGLKGAMGYIDGPRQGVADLSVVASAAGNRLHGRGVLDILRAWVPAGEPCTVVIEDVRPRPGNSTGRGGNTMHSQGSLMRSRGITEAVCDIMPAPVVWVMPQTWKRYYGLIGKDKNESRACAVRLLPSMAPMLARVKDDGRAEALLLAYWGMRQAAE